MKGVAKAGQELRGHERVTAEVKKVVASADPVAAEDVTEGDRHSFLNRVPGRNVHPCGRGTPGVGGGQGVAVNLAVGGQWELVEEDKGRRNHVVRQPCADGPAEVDHRR